VKPLLLITTCDVKFTFVDHNTGEKSEVPAHKFVLAQGSSVFLAQFYGTMKEEKDIIPVQDASVEAFKIFLDTLYNKEISLAGLDFELLAELFYMAKKHHLDLFQASIVNEVSSRKLVSDQVLEAAKLAENNLHLDKFSDSLYQICSMFVIENPKSVLEVFDSEEVGEENSCTLHRLLARANRINSTPQPPSPVCDNCKHDPCLHGELLTRDNFVLDALIRRTDLMDPMDRKTVGLAGSDALYVMGEGTFENRIDLQLLGYKCK